MHTDIQLTDAPIPERFPPMAGAGEVGAWTEFRGLVRGSEAGQRIGALEYEAYAGMVEREIGRLIAEVSLQHPCLAASVVHRVGVIPVGEAAIYVGVASRHRAEGFAFLAAFMDRLKQDVPIWKCRSLPPAA